MAPAARAVALVVVVLAFEGVLALLLLHLALLLLLQRLLPHLLALSHLLALPHLLACPRRRDVGLMPMSYAMIRIRGRSWSLAASRWMISRRLASISCTHS